MHKSDLCIKEKERWWRIFFVPVQCGVMKSSGKRLVFGVIGCGRFGALWASRLSAHGDVLVADAQPGRAEHLTHEVDVRAVPIELAAQADVVFVVVPISSFERVCKDIRPHVRPDTVIGDVCSVKLYPLRVMKKVFPKGQPILSTHPLFGPDSVARLGMVGRKVTVCDGTVDHEMRTRLIGIFKAMGLSVIEATADEHDRDMANSHALVHFIGRGLAELKLKEQPIVTVDYETLLRMQSLVVNDTWQLFHDMQTYNPYAKKKRHALITALQKVEGMLQGKD